MNIESVIDMINEIIEDRSVPKNVKIKLENAQNHLKNDKEEISIRTGSAISILDEVSNDQNIPNYTRTQIWNIVSMLEVIGNQ